MARREYDNPPLQNDSFYIYNPNSSAITIDFRVAFVFITGDSSDTTYSGLNWDIEYGLRNGTSTFEGWQKIPIPDSFPFSTATFYSISLPAGYRLYIRSNEGSFYTSIKSNPSATSVNANLRLVASSRAVAYGNAMYLLDKTGESTTLVGNYNLSRLFYGSDCNIDISVPSFTLPATTLSNYCYSEMFSGNTTVSFVPTLPAINAANHCYYKMFYGCTGLVNNSEITGEICLAHTAPNCCESMFEGCTNLKYPRGFLYSTIVGNREIASASFYNMFKGCTSLICTPYLNRITNHSSTTTTTRVVGNSAFRYMFHNCAALTDVSDNFLQYIDSVEGSYVFANMFQNCTSLNLKTDGTLSFKGGTTSGTITIANYDNPVVFTSSASYCCYQMFYGCTSLGAMYTSGSSTIKGNPIKMLPARVLPSYCYYGMFYGCSNLDISPDILAVDITSYGGTNQFYRMFYNCPKLSRSWTSSFNTNNNNYTLTDTDAIVIRQTDMGRNNAYYQMFYRTSSTYGIRAFNDYHTHPQVWNTSYTNNWWYNAIATSGSYNKVWGSGYDAIWVSDDSNNRGAGKIPANFDVYCSSISENYPIPKWFEIGNPVMAIPFDYNDGTNTYVTDKISGNIAVGPSWVNGQYTQNPAPLTVYYNSTLFPSATHVPTSGEPAFKSWMNVSKISGIDLSSIITSSNYNTGPEYTLMYTITDINLRYGAYETLITEKEWNMTSSTGNVFESLGPKNSDMPSEVESIINVIVICYNNSSNFYTYVLRVADYQEQFITSGKYQVELPAEPNNTGYTCYKKVSTKHTFPNTWGTGATGYSGNLTNTTLYFFRGATDGGWGSDVYARDFRIWKGDKRKLLGIIRDADL